MELLTHSDRIWDLRRGDADDNRTSPLGRGWRQLALSAALDFNYLGASIAFFSLIVLPALLVGFVPPIVVAYGRRNIETAALVGSHPVASVAWLGALLALAIAIGRPLVAKAVEDFWHLHYTLVFPMFVVLRETICAIAERLPPPTMSAEQLGRRRRLGTVLATLLLAGGGLVLAASLEVSGVAGLGTRNVAALAVAGLGNAAVVLALSTAAASLYWFWREMTSGATVLDWAPGPQPLSPAALIRVAHLSDLHLVGERYGYRMESGTSGPRGNGRIRRALQRLAAIDAVTPLDRILVTGDITDAGTRAEWVEFFDLLRRWPRLRARMLFLPGNHDVNIVDRTNPGRFEVPWGVGRALRQMRLVLALDDVQGRAVHVVDRGTGTLGPCLHDYLRIGQRPALLRALAEGGARRGRREMSVVWNDIFPLIAPPEGSGYGVIILDTNATSHFALTNAIGLVSRSQLRALASILRKNPGCAWLILLHHHLVEYPIRSIGLDERIGVTLINAPDVLRVIASCGSSVLVLHGHRHRDWIGTAGKVVVGSAPSVAFGAKGADDGRHGRFHVHEFSVSAAGVVQLIASEQVMVP